MAHRDGYGIGGVDGSERFVQTEEHLHHPTHLGLVGRSVARDRLFHLIGRVLEHLTPRCSGLGHGHTAGLTDAHGGAHVDLEEHPFERHHRGLVLRDEGSQLPLQFGQALGQRVGGRRGDDAGRDGAGLGGAEEMDAAVTAARQTRVDTHHEHMYDRIPTPGSGTRMLLHVSAICADNRPVTLLEEAATTAEPRTAAAVALESVSRSFGAVEAVKDLNLVAPEGRITILLGPNGAGKTTAVRIITGALSTQSGSVSTLGLDPVTDGEAVRQSSGVVAAKPALYDRLSGRENLAYAAALYQVGGRVDAVIADAAARFGIDHALDQLVGGYSTGMKTRLALARSILHSPRLLLLDEPTSGLDPESSQAVLELIRQMTADGTTVVMCTHHLAEAEGLADWIVMLESGTALAGGAPDALIAELWPRQTLVVDAVDPTRLDAIAALPGVLAYERNGAASVEIDSADAIPGIVSALVGAGVQLTRVEPLSRTLADLYFELRRRRP